MNKPKTSNEPKKTPIEEALARYQLTVEKQLEELRAETRTAIGEMRTRLGDLSDWKQGISEELKKMQAEVKEHAHTMNQGLREANTVLRVAVEESQGAKEALAVYERAKEAAPDHSQAVAAIERKVGEMKDHFDDLNGRMSALVGRVDELMQGDFYEEESEETEGNAVAQAILNRN